MDTKRKGPSIAAGATVSSGINNPNVREGLYRNHREAALALLSSGGIPLTLKAGQFLGQLAVNASPLTENQLFWLARLLDKAGLPQWLEGGE